jgi:hypothetical protein
VTDPTIVKGMIDILPALKVPRQYPLALLIQVVYREVKALEVFSFVATQ